MKDLGEEAGRLVYAVLADVDVLLDGVAGSTLAEGGRVEHPAAAGHGPHRNLLVDGHVQHLVDVELARRLLERQFIISLSQLSFHHKWTEFRTSLTSWKVSRGRRKWWP